MNHFLTPIISLFPKSAKNWEILLWILLSGLFSGRFWIFCLQIGFHPKHLAEFYTSILSGIITLLVPLIYWLINGQLPIESLRQRIKGKKNVVYNIESAKDVYINTDQEKVPSPKVISPRTASDLLKDYASESAILANSLFRRSGLYLFIGTIIAVVGVLFFSFQSISSSEQTTSSVILMLAPKVSILIFIEFIAFFFLKQYRSAMDEHRYYESIKRERQRAYVITILLQEENKQISIEKYVEACGFNKEHGKLKKDETTEILESNKLASEEIRLVEKILAVIRKSANK